MPEMGEHFISGFLKHSVLQRNVFLSGKYVKFRSSLNPGAIDRSGKIFYIFFSKCRVASNQDWSRMSSQAFQLKDSKDSSDCNSLISLFFSENSITNCAGVNICYNALQTCREEFQSEVIWKRVFNTFQKKQKVANQDFWPFWAKK